LQGCLVEELVRPPTIEAEQRAEELGPDRREVGQVGRGRRGRRVQGSGGGVGVGVGVGVVALVDA